MDLHVETHDFTSRFSSHQYLHSPKVVRRHRRNSCYTIGCAVLRDRRNNQWGSSHWYRNTGSVTWLSSDKMHNTALSRVCVVSAAFGCQQQRLSELRFSSHSTRFTSLRVYLYASLRTSLRLPTVYSLQSICLHHYGTQRLASKWSRFYDRLL